MEKEEVNSTSSGSVPRFQRVFPADWAALFILLIVTATLGISALSGAQVKGWFLVHLAIFSAYCALTVVLSQNIGQTWVPMVRAAAIIAVMFGLYSTLGQAVFAAVPWNGDPTLDMLDTWLFAGTTPALWAERFASYGTVEFFSFCYGFFIPYLYLSILTGLIGRPGRERRRFITGFAVLYAVSFLGYLFVPAKGPIVQNAAEFAVPLSGGVFHGMVLHVIESAGGPHGAFPSLHVGAAAYACLFDWRYNRLRSATYLPLVILIALATVLLRYHYVIDWLAGLMFAGFAFWSSHAWTSRWEMDNGWAP